MLIFNSGVNNFQLRMTISNISRRVPAQSGLSAGGKSALTCVSSAGNGTTQIGQPQISSTNAFSKVIYQMGNIVSLNIY